jgi:pyrophosphatase PpaX
MKSYQYILLDWDGNLAKTLHIWLQATIDVLNKYDHKHTEAEVIEGLPDLQSLMGRLGIADVAETVDEIKIKVQGLLPDVELYPDALYVLEILKAKDKKLALVTSSNRHLVIDSLKRYNLMKVFDVIVAREDVTHAKPHPEPLEIAINKFKAPRADTIMIGDTEKDVGAANNAGIDSILFFPPEHKRFYDIDKLKKHKPTHIVSDFRHIIEIVG